MSDDGTPDRSSGTVDDLRRHQAIDAAAAQVMESLARQDPRTPRDAALAALGPDAAEPRISEWIGRYRDGD